MMLHFETLLAKRQGVVACATETDTAWEGRIERELSAKQLLLLVVTIDLLFWLLLAWGAVSFML
jgi:hypothetical protein